MLTVARDPAQVDSERAVVDVERLGWRRETAQVEVGRPFSGGQPSKVELMRRRGQGPIPLVKRKTVVAAVA
jgi:hypothetical protein